MAGWEWDCGKSVRWNQDMQRDDGTEKHVHVHVHDSVNDSGSKLNIKEHVYTCTCYVTIVKISMHFYGIVYSLLCVCD